MLETISNDRLHYFAVKMIFVLLLFIELISPSMILTHFDVIDGDGYGTCMVNADFQIYTVENL